MSDLYRLSTMTDPDGRILTLDLDAVEPDYEAMRRAWDAITPCQCGPEYTSRGLVSPRCDNHIVQEELEMLWKAAIGR